MTGQPLMRPSQGRRLAARPDLDAALVVTHSSGLPALAFAVQVSGCPKTGSVPG